MAQQIASEKKIQEYYQTLWSPPLKLDKRDENPLLGFHYGFYEHGIKKWEEAAINMNDFVGRLLHFDSKKTYQILDAGCGSGATSLYLANKYPNVTFTGITLTPAEIEFAKRIQQDFHVDNAIFHVQNYSNTGFSDNYFDGVFALESFCYALRKKDVILELKRILKPGGKLVVIDGFRTEKTLGSFMQNVYQSFLSRRLVPNLISLHDFISYLKREGFTDITIKNMAKGHTLSYNFLQTDFLKFFIKFFAVQGKRLLKGNNYQPKQDLDYIMGALVPEILLGLGNQIGYYAVTAVKT